MTETQPQAGTKIRIINELLRRPGGATLKELNEATGWQGITYINNAKDLARRYGGTAKWKGTGQSRCFWIE
ncbi:DUF3489 domain-containing protein [Nitratireductor rhodophyticola]|uniref:DUF3489 domain-containing protein n=1 Tax=Nitratireductor rhodophyticola TaxID=2854036 RepID=UPI0038F79BCD